MNPAQLYVLATFAYFGLISFIIIKQPFTNKNLLAIMCIAITAAYAIFTNKMKAGGLSTLALITLYVFGFVVFAISYSLVISDKLSFEKDSQKFDGGTLKLKDNPSILDLSATTFTLSDNTNVNNLSTPLLIPYGKAITFGMKYIGDSNATEQSSKKWFCHASSNDFRCNPTAFNTLFAYGDISFGFYGNKNISNIYDKYIWDNLVVFYKDSGNVRTNLDLPIYPNITLLDDGEYHTLTINLQPGATELYVDGHMMANKGTAIARPQYQNNIIFGNSMPIALAGFTIKGDGFLLPQNP